MADEPTCCGACAHLAAVADGPPEAPSTPPLRFALGPDAVPRGAWVVFQARAVALARPRTVIGRSRDCDIVVADPTVSRRTCAIEVDAEGRCFVVDLESACGVVVHGRRIVRVGLHAGDRVRIGDTTFVVERRA